jgi:hypothetical protein
MKCLRFLLALAMLFCGFSTLAKASNFHATVLDPPPTNCSIPTECNVGEQLSFPITLTTMECTDINVPPTPPPTPATDGCFKGFNATGETITSLEVTFADTTGLGTLTCDTADNPPGLPSTVFGADPTCTQSGSTYTLMFSGGAGIAPDGTFIIFEDGAPPGDLGTDSATVGVATPEPDSLLLLSTGALGGLCAFWRRRFGFGAGRI